MLVAAAICPHPPLLIPTVGGSADPAISELRTLAIDAVRFLLDTRPDRLVVVGDAQGTGAASALVRADFRPFGVDFVIGDANAIRLPLSLGVGRWLLREAGWRAPDEPPAGPSVRWQGVARDCSAAEAVRLGATCAGLAPRVAMLVMGDGTARRTEKGPGAFDPAAEVLDDEVATALATADAVALQSLDPQRCDDQLVAGRASWQVLAGAATHSGGSWHGGRSAHTAPLGVAYFVANWRRE